ncbi:MAG: ankyrin repeat domain-containing protein [Pseudomonadota bacterium]
MKFMKVLLAVLVLGFSFNAMAARALTDDESVEFTGAIGEGNMKVIKQYMESGVDVNVGYFAWSPLLMAAAKNQLEAVKYFAEHGANLDYAHPMTRWTAFIHAAYAGNTEMVKYLAAKGADINKKMRGDVSVVRLMRDEGNTKMVELLLSLGVKDDGCQEKCF